MTFRNSQTYDQLMLLQDAAARTSSGAGQVGGSARVLDVGLADMGNVKAVCDLSALSGTTPTETVTIQGSVDAAFTTPVPLGSVTPTAVGRTEIKFSNNQAGTLYRYIRVSFTIGGTSPSFTQTVYITKD